MIFGEPRPVNSKESVVVYDSLLSYFDNSIIRDILEDRRKFGIEKYGQELYTHTGRNMKKDFLEEIVDSIVYLEGVILESGNDFFLHNTKLMLGLIAENLTERINNELQQKSD